MTLTLDWTPNPDHVGFYYARDTGLFARAGLDVDDPGALRSDRTAQARRRGTSDLAVSYEQELFFAAAKKLPVIAVAAVVPQPLNSFIAIEPRSARSTTSTGAASASPASPPTTRPSTPYSPRPGSPART